MTLDGQFGAGPDALLAALRDYREARQSLLAALGCEGSNRDPLAEFAERLAVSVLGGRLAASRVQKGYDFENDAGERVQVRYLANPAGEWVNGHLVDFRGDCSRYALLIFEDLDPRALLVFSRAGLAQVCAALGKRHPDQDVTLQLTHSNYRAIASEPDGFVPWGVRFVNLSLPQRRLDH